MARSIQILKDNREADKHRVASAFAKADRNERAKVEGYHANARALDALHSTGQELLADKIETCRHTARCQSLWCRRCRATAAKTLEKQMLKKTGDVDALYRTLTGKQADTDDDAYNQFMNEQLLHISGYVGLFRLDSETVRRGIRYDRTRWKRIRERKTFERFWVVGNYELELVNFKALMRDIGDDSSKKRLQVKQLTEMSKSNGWIAENEETAVLLHWHGICNGSRNGLTKAIGTDYYVAGKKLYKTHESGLYVQAFHNKRHFEANVSKVASYGFKNATRYKHTFVGSDVGNELMLKQELSELVTLYQEIQGRDWRSLLLVNSVGGAG